MRVILRDLGNGIVDYNDIDLRPTSWSAKAQGGYKSATIEATGSFDSIQDVLRWLRYDLTIINDHNSKVWNGYVNEVFVSLGPVTIGLSLEKMRNRVQIYYTYQTDFGKFLNAKTTWAENNDSVTRYGKREVVYSESDMDAASAAAYAAIQLDLLKYPVSTIALTNQVISARINCRGWWATNDWLYYQDLSGFEGNTEPGSAECPLGLGFISNGVGFYRPASRINDINGHFLNFKAGYKIAVFNSALNNNYFEVATGTTELPYTRGPSTAIFFDPIDDVHDNSNAMGLFAASEMIAISGSHAPSNNGYFTVSSGGDGHLTVSPKTIATQTAGSYAVTIKRGNSIDMVDPVVTEYPSLTSPVNITVNVWGTRMYQSFTPTYNTAPWAYSKAAIRVKKVGTPTDSVRVQIATLGTADAYTVVESSVVPAASIATDMNWIPFAFTGANSLTFGVNYALVVSRTGANDPDNFYIVEVNEATPYTGGKLRLFDGAAWHDRWKDADMPFQITGTMSTSDQLTRILTKIGQFYNSIIVVDPSSSITAQYMGDSEIGSTKVDDLMEYGTNGKRYLAFVNDGRNLQIYKEPDANLANMRFIMRPDGHIVDQAGTKIEKGKLIFGEWIRVDLKLQSIDFISKIDSFFCEECEYNAESGMLTPVPRNNDGQFNLHFLENR